jgi:hypothetical protein
VLDEDYSNGIGVLVVYIQKVVAATRPDRRLHDFRDEWIAGIERRWIDDYGHSLVPE